MKNQLLIGAAICAFLITGCSKSNDGPNYQIDQKEVSMYYDDTHQFKVTSGSTTMNTSSDPWKSSDESVGTIDGHGLFTAKKIGTTTITCKSTSFDVVAEVSVTPYSTLCVEPVVDFGTSIASVKSKEKRTIVSEVSGGVLYKGENSKVRNVMYVFEDGGLKASLLMINGANAVIEESAKFLAERYTFEGTSDNVYIFSSDKVIIGVSVNETFGYHALYIKNTTSKGSNFSTLHQAYNNSLKRLTLKSLN